jgi:hypothetical protein
MRNLMIAALLGALAGCASDDQMYQKQLAYFGPACKKLGYTSKDEIAHCVNHKLDENNYLWANQPTSTDVGGGRVATPIPAEPPKRLN